MSRHHPRRPTLPLSRAALPALTASLAVLSACGDGGAAGDVDNPIDPFARNPIESFVGVWELNGPLNGVPEDEALLVVRPVGADTESRVLVYELDPRDNCYIRSVTNGRAFLDPAFRERVFIRNVASFDEGQLSLSGGDLVITYFDTFDIDEDGDTDESATFTAPSVGISETDRESGFAPERARRDGARHVARRPDRHRLR